MVEEVPNRSKQKFTLMVKLICVTKLESCKTSPQPYIKKLAESFRSQSAAEIFILYNFPRGNTLNAEGRIFGQTLLGTMLTKSCLPEHELGAYDFFDRPSKDPASVHSNTERSVW